MNQKTGKVREAEGDLKEKLLGIGLSSLVAGAVVGAVAYWVGGTTWGLGCGIAAFVLSLAALSAILPSVLRGEDDPASEGEVDDEGYRHGKWLWKYITGEPEREENYDHGIRVGRYVEWYSNGQVRKERNYEVGRIFGPAAEWHENGQKKLECDYHDHEMLNGAWTAWHENGQKHVEAHYVYGTPLGKWTEWNNKGKKTRKSDFIAGIQDCTGTAYFTDPPELGRRSKHRILSLALLVLVGWAVYYQTPVISALLALTVVALIHELGHFLAAECVGIPIKRFAVGFGPKVFSFHFGHTAYDLKLIPLWGYVQEHELRESEIDYFKNAVNALREGRSLPAYPQIDASEPRQVVSEFVTRPRRLVFLLAGVAFNFLTAFLIFWIGWLLTHPDSINLAVSLSESLGNLCRFMLHPFDFTQLAPLHEVGLFWIIVAFVSVWVGMFNLLPLGFLDGFKVLRTVFGMMLRQEVADRFLFPLKIAGTLILIAFLAFDLTFFGATTIGEISRTISGLSKPDIIGRLQASYYFEGSVTLIADSKKRPFAASEGRKLLMVVFVVEGPQTLLTSEYVLAVAGSDGEEYRPVGVLFGKPRPKPIFIDSRRAKQVELRHATDGTITGSSRTDSATGESQIGLVEPWVVLLYEVEGEDDWQVFKFRYGSFEKTITPLQPPKGRKKVSG